MKKKKLEPIYKMVKVPKEFCPQCNKRLEGMNNYFSPWRCACGVWRYNWEGRFYFISDV
jgi:hypothetical protein